METPERSVSALLDEAIILEDPTGTMDFSIFDPTCDVSSYIRRPRPTEVHTKLLQCGLDDSEKRPSSLKGQHHDLSFLGFDRAKYVQSQGCELQRLIGCIAHTIAKYGFDREIFVKACKMGDQEAFAGALAIGQAYNAIFEKLAEMLTLSWVRPECVQMQDFFPNMFEWMSDPIDCGPQRKQRNLVAHKMGAGRFNMLDLHRAKYEDIFEPAAFFDNLQGWVFGRISQEVGDLLLILDKDIDSYPVIIASDQALRAKSRQDNEVAAERMIQSDPALCALQVGRACWLGLGHMSGAVSQMLYDQAHARLPAIGKRREALMKQAKAKLPQRSAVAWPEDRTPIHAETTANRQWDPTSEAEDSEYEIIGHDDCHSLDERFQQDAEFSQEQSIYSGGNNTEDHCTSSSTEGQSLINKPERYQQPELRQCRR